MPKLLCSNQGGVLRHEQRVLPWFRVPVHSDKCITIGTASTGRQEAIPSSRAAGASSAGSGLQIQLYKEERETHLEVAHFLRWSSWQDAGQAALVAIILQGVECPGRAIY